MGLLVRSMVTLLGKEVRVHRRAALVVTVLAGGCNPAGQDPVVIVGDSAGVPVHSLSHLPAWDEPEYQWGLTLERSIPTAAETPGGEPLLYQPQAYARLADGTLVVLDAADLRIAILHPSRNEVVRRFARSGGGPGEISTWPSLSIWPAGPSSFWVFDPGNQRLSRFNVDGTVEGERPVRFSGSVNVAFQDPVDHAPWLWNSFMVRQGEVATLVDSIGRLDLEGRQIDYIAPMAPRVEEYRFNPPAGPRDRLAPLHWFAPLGPAGVVSGRGDSERFRQYSRDGTLLRVIDVAMEQAAVALSDKPDIEAMYEGISAGVDYYVGERYRLYDLMWGVEDSLFALQQSFLSTPSGERRIPDDQMVWRIFSTGGQYEGTIAFPAGIAQPYWIERGRVIATYRDELGVVTIREYRLAGPG